MKPVELKRLRVALLEWYDANARDLPWRRRDGGQADPYAVWVSEVMLQQTRVETVRPYFERWMQEFPDLETLAAAPADRVLKAWEGLGYYSRARNLHAAVREAVATYGGVPSEPEALLSLPGVGRYTAGAIASIAFGREAPVVDGNVRRVFARLFDRAQPGEAELWDFASRLVVGERPGDLNQAMMELGATVCLPRSPVCRSCPVQEFCIAARRGTAEQRPAPKRRSRLPVEEHGVAVIRAGDDYLLVRGREKSRLGGLWGFPSTARDAAETLESAARRSLQEFHSGPVAQLEFVGRVTHVFTHVKVVYTVFTGAASPTASAAEPGDRVAWVPPARFRDFAMSRAHRRIVALLDLQSPTVGSAS